MYLEIFLADLAVFRVFFGGGFREILLNFAGPQPHKISEALFIIVSTRCDVDPTSRTFAATNCL